MSLQTLVQPVEFTLEIKKSRFLGRVEPINSQEEGLALIEQLRLAHPEARHLCFCMLNKGQVRQSDDGEPSGTAAAPMLNVLQHKNLDGVLATVVRYFGGIKLGAGGLTRAYSQTLSQALQDAEFASLVELETLGLKLDFAHENTLRHLAKLHQLSLELNYAQTGIQAELTGEKEPLEQLVTELSNQLSGELEVLN